MASRGKLIATLVVAAFAAFLLYTTLAGQNVVCTVAVEFQGRSNEATASAETESAAVQRAQDTACGTISSGMTDRVACTNTPPVKRSCRPA
ncbi:MAG: hypothetical protein H0U85_06290 [Gemmatimonadales bacterium]|nr:hypothetical protein [Gemmatimonadales bacterium]